MDGPPRPPSNNGGSHLRDIAVVAGPRVGVMAWYGVAYCALAYYVMACNGVVCDGLSHHAMTLLCLEVMWYALPWLGMA